jgi:hypothetical protein
MRIRYHDTIARQREPQERVCRRTHHNSATHNRRRHQVPWAHPARQLRPQGWDVLHARPARR